MTTTSEKGLVIISVMGGVAEVVQCPDGVEVEIQDWDDCAAGSDADYCREEG